MNRIIKDLEKRLEKRTKAGSKRSLVPLEDLTGQKRADFTSNDYLGLARSKELTQMIREAEEGMYGHGSTGSRLLSGDSYFARDLEYFLADFHQHESALLFNSGFDANMGLFDCIAKPGDAILYDELIHASVHMGMKTSRAAPDHVYSFKHNSVSSLISGIKRFYNLKKQNGAVYVAVESIYSMDGTICRLEEMVKAVEEEGFDNVHFIVDEAHATGILGRQGRGLVDQLGLCDKIFARVHTFGKAMGCHGAAILGPLVLKEYLLNYAKPLVFSTALPAHSLVSISCTYTFMIANHESLSTKLDKLILYFRQQFALQKEHNPRLIEGVVLLDSTTPIQGLLVPGNHQVLNASSIARSSKFGLDVRPIRFPTVPKGKERIRICVHAHNTFSQVDTLITGLFETCRSDSASDDLQVTAKL